MLRLLARFWAFGAGAFEEVVVRPFAASAVLGLTTWGSFFGLPFPLVGCFLRPGVPAAVAVPSVSCTTCLASSSSGDFAVISGRNEGMRLYVTCVSGCEGLRFEGLSLRVDTEISSLALRW